jgi:hypothetical protein
MKIKIPSFAAGDLDPLREQLSGGNKRTRNTRPFASDRNFLSVEDATISAPADTSADFVFTILSNPRPATCNFPNFDYLQ